jgi:hypothetical protein
VLQISELLSGVTYRFFIVLTPIPGSIIPPINSHIFSTKYLFYVLL